MDKIRKQPVDWQSIYRSASENVREPKPHEFSVLASGLAPKGHATDLGSGEGYDALHFAKQGFATTAIDISEVALERLSEQASQKTLDISTKLENIKLTKLTRPQSLLASYGALHFLGTSYEEQMAHFKDMTLENGVHSIYTFGSKGDFYDIGKDNYWFPDIQELKTIYEDWDIIRIEEKDIELLIRGDGGEILRNSLLKIIAQKQPTT